MQQYGLIGCPLGHSLSPQIHEALFALEGRRADYTLYEFPPEELEARFPALKALDGFNVTIPYKQAILPLLDGLSGEALLYGSVNTVRREGSRRIGCNTDCDGFLRTMRAHNISLETSVCVLGAGGVGRMFAIECARQGARVTLAVRAGSRHKADALAAELREKTGAAAEIRDITALSDGYGLLINATPVGMYPKTGVSPVSPALLERTDAVFDCVYNPAETALLRDARALGKTAAGGMDMLVWQAAAAHEIWCGRKTAPADAADIAARMNEYLLQKEREA